MDPFAHTFTGAALAASGLRKTTPLATAALVLGANAPDIDVLVSFAGEYMSLAHRRGWTHGILAWLVLPCLLTALLLAWDRLVRQKRVPRDTPANGMTLLMLSTLAVLSHPALDWLNNYGIRLLMPFDGRWFYGDALFIVDPWVWLMLGGACFLVWSRGTPSLLGWLSLWGAATWLVLSNDYVTGTARLLWIGGLLVLFGMRYLYPDAHVGLIARWTLFVAVFYMGINTIAGRQAEKSIERMVEVSGAGEVIDVMAGPWPANPFRGNVVVVTKDNYLLGSWNWLDNPRLHLFEESIPRNMENPAVQAAAKTTLASRFLVWSRYPYAEVETTVQGYSIRFADARYARFGDSISGPVVLLDQALNIVPTR